MSIDIELHKPATLEDAMALACAYKEIFNYLPSLRMAPLRLPFLRMHLHICHPSAHEATILPFLMTWHGSETGKDPNAPALVVHSHLSYHLHVRPTSRSSSSSSREHLQPPSSIDAAAPSPWLALVVARGRRLLWLGRRRRPWPALAVERIQRGRSTDPRDTHLERWTSGAAGVRPGRSRDYGRPHGADCGGAMRIRGERKRGGRGGDDGMRKRRRRKE
jgi:hypothetical protein